MPALTSTSVVITPTLEPNVFTPQTAVCRRGLPIRISPYIKVNGADLDDLTDIVNVIAKIVPIGNLLSVLVSKSEAGVHLAGQGGSGAGPGCVDFDFTSAEMNLDLTGGDGNARTFRVMFSATLTGSVVIPLGVLDLTVYEDASALALAVIGSNSQNARITTANKFQLKDPDTGLFHDIFITDGQIAIGPGEA